MPHGLAGPKMAFAIAMIFSKTVNKTRSVNVNQPDITKKMRQKNGAKTPLHRVQAILVMKSHVMVFMVNGDNGHLVTSLVFTEAKYQSKLGSGIAMIQSQVQVN